MSKFRRNLLKIGGVMSTEQFVRKHLLCWFSPTKQGATNESLAADPRLLDLSGHGNDLNLIGPAYANGVGMGDGYLNIEFPTNYGQTRTLKVLKRFTVIADRYHGDAGQGSYLAGKGRAFFLETVDYGKRNFVFGHSIVQTNSTFQHVRSLAILTPTEKWDYGSDKERDKIDPGFETDVLAPLAIGGRFYSNGNISARLYEFMLFDRVLNDEQIKWVVDNLINSRQSNE